MVRTKQRGRIEADKARIVIVDDHPIVRQGLADLINEQKDLEVCAQAADAEEAMQLVKEFEPDLAVVDITLKNTSGLELIKDINAGYPKVLVLTLSMHDELVYSERALRAGAKGYIMKAEATENVLTAIRRVLNGQIYVSDKMTARMINKLVTGHADVGTSVVDLLSDRELEVFGLIGRGYKTHEISQRLHVSVKTVDTYRAHIKEKLNLADAAELLRYAIQWSNSQNQ